MKFKAPLRTLSLAVLAAVLALGVFFPSQLPAQEETPDGRVGLATSEYRNIVAAANFLKSVGEEDAAKEIRQRLKNREYYLDSTISGNAVTSGFSPLSSPDILWNRVTSLNKAQGKIRLNPALTTTVRGPGVEYQGGNPTANFTEIANLAKTLYHENLHTHQSGYDRTTANAATEVDAWSQTIAKQGEWRQKLADKVRKDIENPNINPLVTYVHAQQYKEFMESYNGTVSSFQDHEKKGGEEKHYGKLDVTDPKTGRKVTSDELLANIAKQKKEADTNIQQAKDAMEKAFPEPRPKPLEKAAGCEDCGGNIAGLELAQSNNDGFKLKAWKARRDRYFLGQAIMKGDADVFEEMGGSWVDYLDHLNENVEKEEKRVSKSEAKLAEITAAHAHAGAGNSGGPLQFSNLGADKDAGEKKPFGQDPKGHLEPLGPEGSGGDGEQQAPTGGTMEEGFERTQRGIQALIDALEKGNTGGGEQEGNTGGDEQEGGTGTLKPPEGGDGEQQASTGDGDGMGDGFDRTRRGLEALAEAYEGTPAGEEAKRKAEEEAKRKAEEEAKRKAEEEAKRKRERQAAERAAIEGELARVREGIRSLEPEITNIDPNDCEAPPDTTTTLADGSVLTTTSECEIQVTPEAKALLAEMKAKEQELSDRLASLDGDGGGSPDIPFNEDDGSSSAPPLYGPHGVVSQDFDFFGETDKDGNHTLTIKWVGEGPPPPGYERGYALNEDGDLVPVSRPWDPLTKTYTPLDQTPDKAREPSGPDLKAFREKLRAAIKTRDNLRPPPSSESKTEGIPDAFDEGPDVRAKARMGMQQRLRDAEATKPKPRPTTTASRPPSGSTGTATATATPTGTQVGKPAPGGTQTVEPAPGGTSVGEPTPQPTFVPPPVETIYEERSVTTETTVYDCGVKPYTGPTRNKQAQQALIDNYNANCR